MVGSIDKLKILITQKVNNGFALHGSSFDFITNILNNGFIGEGGNYNNYMYLLIEPKQKGVDIYESAIYYAYANAIKSLLFSKYPEIRNTIISKDFDQYLFMVGLVQYTGDLESIPQGFDIFNADDLEHIRLVIRQCKDEDRKGIIVHFSKELFEKFDIDPPNETGQTRILLSQHIVLEDISSIELLGKYELQAFKDIQTKYIPT